eukprot:TRINITY_DN14974_c0_g1_i1.p1 TRINITY_DN14974_c0_g1~~TRINITY_DN14974_c0_g1_i1.p1  ORF type:complete len:507 (+),score=134.41 TRINITY_DN14974_c0_g1_i1:190-1521(+)
MSLDEEDKRLLRKRHKLKAQLASIKSTADELDKKLQVSMTEMEAQEKLRMQHLEEMSARAEELKDQQKHRADNIIQELEKLNAAVKVCSETEVRVQFLVERIVALLSNSSLEPGQIELLKQKRQEERDKYEQFQEIRHQYDDVRQQNGELTQRLNEESSLSRRLSDQLAEVEERFLRLGNGIEHAPGSKTVDSGLSSTAGRSNAEGRKRNDADTLLEEDEGSERPSSPPGPVPPLPFSLRRDDLEGLPLSFKGSRSEGSSLLAVPEAEATSGGSPERQRSSSSSEGPASESRAQQDDYGSFLQAWPSQSASAAEKDVAEWARRPGSEGEEREEMDEADQGACPRSEGPADHQLMETMLMEALDRVAFGFKVVRWQPGIYGFGGVKALLQLDRQSNLMAASQEDANRGLPFVPIEQFLQDVASVAGSTQRDTVVEECDEEEEAA